MTTAVTQKPIQPIANADTREVSVLINQTDSSIQKVKDQVFSPPGTDLEDQSVTLPSPRTFSQICQDELSSTMFNTWLAVQSWLN